MPDKRFVGAVWAIMDELNNSDQLENSLENCIGLLCDYVQAKSGSMWMINHYDNRYYIVASKAERDLTGISTGVNDSFIGDVIKNKDTRIIEDCSRVDEIRLDKEFGSLFGKNAILVPLKNPHGVVGVLQFNDSERGFTKEDEELLEN